MSAFKLCSIEASSSVSDQRSQSAQPRQGVLSPAGHSHERLVLIIFAPLPEDIQVEHEHCGKKLCFELVWGCALSFFFVQVRVLVASHSRFSLRVMFQNSTLFCNACMGCVVMVGCPFFMAPHVHTIVFKDGFLGFCMAQPIEQQEADRWRDRNSASQRAAAQSPHTTLFHTGRGKRDLASCST